MSKATQANGQKKAPANVIALNQGQAYDLSNSKLTKRELAGKGLFNEGMVRQYQPEITSEPEPVFVYAMINGYCVTYEVVPPGITGTMHCECPDRKHNLKDAELCKHLYAARHYAEANREALAMQQPEPKPLTKDDRITRLATLNTATAILQSHNKPIELRDVIELATQLEMWAHGKDKEVRNSIVNGYIDEMFN